MNEQANQLKQKDPLLPSSLPSTGLISGDEQVALELGSCPSGVPEDSYSTQVSSQYRRILQVKAVETLQQYQPSTLFFQVVSSLRSSYASSYVRYHKVESCVGGVGWHHYRFDKQHATSCFDHRYGVRGISNQSTASVVNEAARAAPPFVVCAANSLPRSLLGLTAVGSLSRRAARLMVSLPFSFNRNICHF